MSNRINKPTEAQSLSKQMLSMLATEINPADKARLEAIYSITAEQFLEREKISPKVHLTLNGHDQKFMIRAILTEITGHPGFVPDTVLAIVFQCVSLKSIEAGVKQFFDAAAAFGAKFPEFTIPLFTHFIRGVYPELEDKPQP